MRLIFVVLCFTFLNVCKLTFADHEHPPKMYEELCGSMDKNRIPLGIEDVIESIPSSTFRVVEGCGKTRSYFASLAKPEMEFKTEADYDNMCTKFTINGHGLTGTIAAFQINSTWVCTVSKDKGICECTFTSSNGKKSDKAFVYLTLVDVKAKLYMAVLCFHELKELGWVVGSLDKTLKPEKQKVVDNNLYALGFKNLALGKSKMHMDKCP